MRVRRLAVATCALACLGGFWTAEAAAGPLVWGEPVAIDRQAPFSNPSTLGGVSCPADDMCVAVDLFTGDVVTSTDPRGGPASWNYTWLPLSRLIDRLTDVD